MIARKGIQKVYNTYLLGSWLDSVNLCQLSKIVLWMTSTIAWKLNYWVLDTLRSIWNSIYWLLEMHHAWKLFQLCCIDSTHLIILRGKYSMLTEPLVVMKVVFHVWKHRRLEVVRWINNSLRFGHWYLEISCHFPTKADLWQIPQLFDPHVNEP